MDPRRAGRVRHGHVGGGRAVVERADRHLGPELRRPRPVGARTASAPECPVPRAAGDPRRLLLGRLLDRRRLPAGAHARGRRALVERARADHRAERPRHRAQRPRLRPPAADRARRGDDRAQGRLLAALVGASGERRVLAAVPDAARPGRRADLPAGRLVRPVQRLASALIRRDRRPCLEPGDDRAVVARGGCRELLRRYRPLARLDRDSRPRARLLRPVPQGRGERLGRAAARRALRPRRERVARRAATGRSSAPGRRRSTCARAGACRSRSRAPTSPPTTTTTTRPTRCRRSAGSTPC